MPTHKDEEMLFPPVSTRPRRSTAEPTDYHKLAFAWEKVVKTRNQALGKLFSCVQQCALKVNLNSGDPRSYDEALASPDTTKTTGRRLWRKNSILF